MTTSTSAYLAQSQNIGNYMPEVGTTPDPRSLSMRPPIEAHAHTQNHRLCTGSASICFFQSTVISTLEYQVASSCIIKIHTFQSIHPPISWLLALLYSYEDSLVFTPASRYSELRDKGSSAIPGLRDSTVFALSGLRESTFRGAYNYQGSQGH